MSQVRTLQAENLEIRVYDHRADMGRAAALHAAELIRAVAEEKGEVNVIFAAAPSQNEFLEALRGMSDIPWNQINAFHMDEYIGLPADAPQGFANFLRRSLFDLVPFKTVNCLNGQNPDPGAECARYAALLREHPADLICMGIGENGHIAFNDPPVADFDDPLDVKVVELEARCRQQQVNDGCFASLNEVPTHAMTLTVPLMMRAPRLILVVPTSLKAQAIRDTARGPVSTRTPASAVRRHVGGATLYTDEAGASLL